MRQTATCRIVQLHNTRGPLPPLYKANINCRAEDAIYCVDLPSLALKLKERGVNKVITQRDPELPTALNGKLIKLPDDMLERLRIMVLGVDADSIAELSYRAA